MRERERPNVVVVIHVKQRDVNTQIEIIEIIDQNQRFSKRILDDDALGLYR